MTRIDCIFCTARWEDLYSHPIIYPLSSSILDHCPLFLDPLAPSPADTKFYFESLWLDMPGFQQCVIEAWEQQMPSQHNPMMKLHIKLARTMKALRGWSNKLIPYGKITMAICMEVIAQLDQAHEFRPLAL